MFTQNTYPKATFTQDAVIRMGLQKRYIMPLFYSMHLVECPDIPTAATNGVTMWINRTFWSKLNRDQRVTLLAHEIGHKMLMHNTRRGNRDPYIYNIAGDHVINIMLVKSSYTPLNIPGVVEWFCDMAYDGKSTEEVYDILKKQYKNKPLPGKGKPCPDGQPSDPQPGSGDPNAKADLGPMADVIEQGKGLDGKDDADAPDGHDKAKESQAEFEGRVRRELEGAKTLAKIAGVGAFGIDRAIEAANDAQQLPWYVLLMEYMRAMKADEYDFGRVDRRGYAITGAILPSLWSEQMGGMAWGIDCSGSISQTELAEFKYHGESIVEQVHPEWVEAIHFHSNVFKAPRFERGEEIALSPTESGGTDFGPVMEHVRNMSEKPEVLIMLTDMYGPFGEDPGVPVIWVSTSHKMKAPFGTVILMHG
jgi:predicted metal-dependent peptidase